jgi:ferredoxin--NADP+ reductase
MANLSDYDITKTWHAEVKSSARITPENTDEVRSLSLHVADEEFHYQVGQSVGVLIPGPHPFGNAQHLRLYSIAGSTPHEHGIDLELCVRRCFYIDEVSGERYPGIASNRLCDAKLGEQVLLTGPYNSQFRVPEDKRSNLLMIGTGTGIAPFRAFLQQVYEREPDWQGQVRLYYGARSGMERLYHNDRNNDLANYYDQRTFKAIEGLSRRPWLGEEKSLDQALQQHAQDIWTLMQDEHTCVYLAGLERISLTLDKAMAEAAGSENRWRWARQELMRQGRWSELLYS